MKNIINMFEKDSIEILTAESSHSFPLHSHESFCMGIVNQGKVRFRIGEQEKVLSRGMMYLIPSNVGVVITPVERYGYTTICFKNEKKEYLMQYRYEDYFPEFMLPLSSLQQQNGEYSHQLAGEDTSLQTDDEDDRLHFDAEAYLKKLCDDYRQGGTSEDYMRGILSILRPFMLEKDRTQEEKDDFIELAKEYIRQHIYERFNLEALAEHVHMSKYHFIRKFKQKTGVTPNQYYIQIKMFVAKQALKQNEKETDLAAELNFSDQSYMCNVFKKQMGISMTDFKEHYIQQ